MEDKKYKVTTGSLKYFNCGDIIHNNNHGQYVKAGEEFAIHALPEDLVETNPKWFKPVKEDLQLGDYVYRVWPSGNKTFGKIVKNRYPSTKQFRFLALHTYEREGRVCSGHRYALGEDYKYEKITSNSEIERNLKTEFKNRYKDEVPCKVKYFDEGEGFLDGAEGADYLPDKDCLAVHNDPEEEDIMYIYKDGKWAEVLEKTPNITINGYKAQFFDTYVKFGCATIEASFFTDLARCIWQEDLDSKSVIGNRILDGFKFGDRIFTIEEVLQIASYYE